VSVFRLLGLVKRSTKKILLCAIRLVENLKR
jgi:hypothetical protein